MTKQAGSLALYAIGVVAAAALARVGWEFGEKLWMML